MYARIKLELQICIHSVRILLYLYYVGITVDYLRSYLVIRYQFQKASFVLKIDVIHWRVESCQVNTRQK